jgi:hypothetical protein
VRDPEAGAGAIEGRVVSVSTGRGVEGATIEWARDGATVAVRSGEGGAFVFAAPAAGTYVVAVVTAQGYLPFAPEWGHSPLVFEARAGARVRDVLIHLTPAIEYVGVVVDPAGEPVAGAEARLLGAPAEQALAPLGDHWTTDARGEFRFQAPDETVIEARHEGFAPARGAVDFGVQVSRRMTLRLAAREQGAANEDGSESIAGRVLSPEGEPVAEALVRASFELENRATRHAEMRAGGQTVTDEEGRFTIDGLDRGAYALTASHPEHAPGEAEGVASGRRDVELRLARGARLAGRVTDGAGAPVAAFTIVVATSPGPLERTTAAARSVFDPEGRFAIENLQAGAYVVSASAHGFAPSPEQPATVPGEVTIRLARGGSLRARVITRGTDRPIEGARITAEGMATGATSAVPVLASAITAADGTARLTGLAPGLSSVSVAAGGHHGRIVSNLDVRESVELGPITVELTPVGDGEEPRLELAGIGAVLAAEGEGLVIGDVLPGGGAAEAGLTRGDTILAIDGTPVTALGFAGSINRIRGPEGTSVLLRVVKAGTTAPINLPVLRRIVRS